MMCLLLLQREGKAHFNCTDLEGVELENQGGDGTQGDHWEKRALGVSGMQLSRSNCLLILLPEASPPSPLCLPRTKP